MMKSDCTLLEKIQQTVKDCTKKPEAYLSIQDSVSQDLKNSIKDLYDLAVKTKSLKPSNSDALPELIVNGFDAEQIWQQLELENNEEFSRLSLGKISKTLASKNSWVLPLKVIKDGDEQESKPSDDENEEKNGYLSEESSDDELTMENDHIKKRIVTKNIKKRKRTTEVDDQFFKLDELDEYLKKEDKKERKTDNKRNDDSSDEEKESIDLFNNFSDLDEEEQEDDEIKNGRSVKYADFFDSPESGDEQELENNEVGSENGDDGFNEDDSEIENDMDDSNFNEDQRKKFKKEQKQVKFNLLDNSEESDSIENMKVKNQENDKISKGPLSSLEARQERLQKRIKELEGEAVAEKPWQMKGETSASSRPPNSLLEEYVEFDSVSRPAPVMTKETTMKLEDIIRKRITDKAWDDVEKKFKPVETPMEYKKKLIMNQEKSKESLAQIYENEYVKQREALNAEDKDEQEKPEPPEHIEIKEKMYSLFRKLDALSNFHYTPKPAKPETKIVSNVPAISMEEVAPVATSDATLLAPEEVKSKRKGELIGKSERTKTDMKRERRKKKLKQHDHAVHQSKQEVDNVKKKKSMKNKLGKLKARNIINADEISSTDPKAIKSSTAFFSQLQDQVQSSIKAKTNKSGLKKSKETLSAVRLKL